jgi:hypothetical protein
MTGSDEERSLRANSTTATRAWLGRGSLGVSVLVAIGYFLLRTTGIGELHAVVRSAPLVDGFVSLSMVGAASFASRVLAEPSPSRVGAGWGAGVFLLGQGVVHAVGLDVVGALLQLSGLATLLAAGLALSDAGNRKLAAVLCAAGTLLGIVAVWIFVLIVNIAG